MKTLIKSSLLAVFLIGGGAGILTAQVQQQSIQAVYTTEQIVSALLPTAATGDSRGIQRDMNGNQMPTGAKAALLVTFEPETERLSVQGMRTLQALAHALQDPRLAGAQFQVLGHGYAAADPQLGVRTQRRAQTVVDHLAGFYNINPAQFYAVGVGPAAPANPMFPGDPLNSRIEVVNVSFN